jgi:ubiquinone/menaquinone biosynthesis C-methylase UbiE
VGCGLGYLTEAIGQNYQRIGIDNEMRSLKANHKRGAGEMVFGSASNLPFEDQAFDVILCSEVLEHLPTTFDEKALIEMSRVLRSDGQLFVTIPSLEGLRATSKLRNLGHDDPNGGEYHYRMGYSLRDIKNIVKRIPSLEIMKHRYSMFLLSEIMMDLSKWGYFKKNKFKEHSDLADMNESPFLRVYRFLFPLLHTLFILEDFCFCRFFKGHILLLVLKKQRS